ncbi:MAG: glycosyltransferase [Bacteroidales bacterium]|nr:glycosyltransferase [Bacteroidales bacterium]
MNKVKVSVIVPVYNIPDEMLRDCVESLQAQMLKNVEFIFINDCSPLKSNKEYLTSIAEQDDRVILIDLPQNQGVSNARNKGIERASGDYLCFVDADDILTSGTLEKLFSIAQSNLADIAISTCRMDLSADGSRFVLSNQTSGVFSNDNAESYTLELIKQLKLSLCGKLFKKTLFDGILIPCHIAFYEDYTTLWSLAKRCKQYAVINHIGYIARCRLGSASRQKINVSVYVKRMNSLIYACTQMKNLFKDNQDIIYFLSGFIVVEGLANRMLYADLLPDNVEIVSKLTVDLWTKMKECCFIPWYMKCLLSLRVKYIVSQRPSGFPAWQYYPIRLALRLAY